MKTKIILIASAFFLLSNNSFSQSPNWGWSTNAVGNSYEESSSVTTDVSGNVYITGSFYSSSIDFGVYTLINADPTGNKSDMFIAKYDSLGNVLWAESSGGLNEDGGYSVTTDASGNAYVTGYFASTSISFGSTTLVNAGLYDMFIVKYDASGNVLWTKSAGKIGDDYGRSITTDASNNVYVTGSFQSPTIRFDLITLTNTDTSGTTYDMYILKYDSTGTVLWADSKGGKGTEYARSIAVDSANNVFICGNFDSDTLIFNTDTLINVGAFDAYLTKYNATGNEIWAKSYGGTGIDFGNCVAKDPNGNVFLSGGFYSPTISFGATTLTNGGTYNLYIMKADGIGTTLWASGAAGNGIDDGKYVTTDNSGNAYITGYFTSSTLTFGTTTLTNVGNNDVLVVKYRPSGLIVWAKSAGDINDERGISIATHSSDVYITGSFNSPSIDFGSTTLYNNGWEDVFLAKISPPSTIGITEQNSSDYISISPNPFNDQTTITFPEMQTNILINISDVLGKEIKNIYFTGKQLVIEKEEMKEGIYFITIVDENKNVSNRKIIIQ